MKPSIFRFPISLAIVRRKIHSLASGHAHKAECSPVPVDIKVCRSKSNIRMDVDELFDEMPELDVLSVTTLIGRFARQHRYEEAMCLFSRMLLLNIKPNEFTFATVIHSSTGLKNIYLGKQLHARTMKMGLNTIVFVGSAMLDFYAKLCSFEEARNAFEDIQKPNVVSYTTLIHGYLKKGKIDDALQLFQEMPERNVVSWNAMVGGFSQMGHNEEAVSLFIEMLREGFMPNQSTFPCAITSAANMASLGMGKSFHACAVKSLCTSDVFVCNSLVSFYAKCGSMEDSLLVFNELPDRNTVSWNAVICGFAQNGRGEDAVIFFERMRAAGLRPNSVTLLGLLCACNHAGLVEKGYMYFNQMRQEEPGILKPEHYACMVDLLSRFGRLKEAAKFLHDLPFDPGTGFWKALLGGCHIHSNAELSDLAAQKILALDPEDVSSYVMLSNAYSAAGRWQQVSTIRREMKEKGLKRIPGCSWIEVRSKIHVFLNSDKNHHQKEEIYSFLKFCVEQLREIEGITFSIEY
ncbi:pentatricopeptide repeat-containing protein At5g42450, mitochondrial [Ricinus communis]|uniref:Pentatricopeptide repeat-containing protein, putative n=1 Tax=Ricinus communis TaxID=3988 RepID=B9T435_RICCO|nr:pentatricopeptide repeat-containing protein At5g42450, mitochondrial [Ricinus communis]EEF29379.1 pentatricopeptide repeat-containing protein, putative [Ricinus communis]|eukprot:XP_002533004.1 pentatricopeptide repeat-containing protein At5g42450, mitochondrial [Ricinus communis]